MMTELCEMIMECRVIDIDDRVILYGWAAQLAEGNDTLYCSKDTVAHFLGVSKDTVKRRTKRLLGKGLLIDTGEEKQWQFARTPVLVINVPVIMGLVEAQVQTAGAGVQKALVQNAPQGYGSRFTSSFDSPSPASSDSEFISEGGSDKSKEGEQTENRESENLEPKPTPTPHAHNSCSGCGEALDRNVNHFLVCPVAKGNSTLDEYLLDKSTYQPPDMSALEGGLMPVDDRDWRDGRPLFPSINSPQAEEARKRVDAERQKSNKIVVKEGRATPTANASHAQPPVAPAPLYLCMVCEQEPVRSPTSDYCEGCRNNDVPVAIPKGAIPKTVDEIRPTSINT